MFCKVTANTEVVEAKPRPVAECGSRLLRAPVPVFSPARQHLPSLHTLLPTDPPRNADLWIQSHGARLAARNYGSVSLTHL